MRNINNYNYRKEKFNLDRCPIDKIVMQGEIWNHMKKIFTIDRVNEDIQRWNEFLANGDTRRDYKCFGCGRFGRNDDVCMSVPIYIMCDTYFST
jgi:hypothetical protein